MKDFEEQFPELKDDSRWCSTSIADPHSDSSYYWSEESLKKYCLSKQRVKEAIDKTKIFFKDFDLGEVDEITTLEYFCKQLGLED